MIRLEHIQKIYHSGGIETPALKDVSLNIGQGDYISIMGTSGCGKSTLLNILGCMDSATAGSYYFDDVAVHALRMKELHRFRKQHVSFIFQNFALLDRYTVFENVELPLLAQGIGASARKKRVMETLEEVGITGLKDKLPIHISGGQQQRTAIARALVADQDIILADEPTGALDQNTSREIMELLDAINRRGKTIVVVTHDAEVAAHATRHIRMEDGMCVE